jgi:hemoglobin-like flavoprotein
VQQPAHAVAQESYARCIRVPGFLERFYEILLASDPSVPGMFVGTEFPRQRKLLQHGLGLLLSYAKHPDDELLARLAARHSAQGLDVAPAMYEHFLASLLQTVREYDPRFTEEIGQAWREAALPGIDFMKSRYDP